MASLVGKWEYATAENLDAYMEAAAIPENLREMAKNSKPLLEISNDGDSWTLKTTVSDKVKDTTFKVGAEFDSVSLAGQPLKCTVSIDGEVMTETQKLGDVSIVITREVVGDQLVSKMTIKDATATISFKKA